ncbi:hypothetical protein [Chitinilyticum aquatile]|nr:hypothetical protein [Chitinilyticum aquatile]
MLTLIHYLTDDSDDHSVINAWSAAGWQIRACWNSSSRFLAHKTLELQP